jgi:hypothetical protein
MALLTFCSMTRGMKDASQVMPDLLLPAMQLLSTAINRFWHDLTGQEAGFAVQAGLIEVVRNCPMLFFSSVAS